MAGYTRQSEASIQPGEDIDAGPMNTEFDAIETAFGTSGHTHDGTSGNGPKIPFASLLDTIDEDNMATNSATKIPTQQSVKAYVDSGVPRLKNAQTGTTYTLVLSDAQKVLTFNNASGTTVTIPPNSSVAFPINTQIDIISKGVGTVTLDLGSGVTVNGGTSDINLGNQYTGNTLFKDDTDTWFILGALA